jgi:HEAT repeat protein
MREELRAIEALGASGDIDGLAPWLAHEDWQVRRAAADAIVEAARTGDARARGAAVEHLVAGLASEENAGLRSAAQEALTRLAPHAAARLAREIASAPVDVQILAAPVLGESGAAEAVDLLVALSRSDDPNVAAAGVVGLGRLRRREAAEPLLAVLDAGDPWLTFAAVEALGVLGDERAVAPVAARMGDPLLASTAIEALVRIGGPAAARALAARLFDGAEARGALLDALVRLARERAPHALARAGREAAAAAFRVVFRPEHFDALAEQAWSGSRHADAALEALGWTGDERALAILLPALAKPATQTAAAAGLEALFADPALAALSPAYAGRVTSAVRLELARALAPAAPAEAARLLAELLADADEEIWRDATEIAGEVVERLEERESLATPAALEAATALAEATDLLEPEARMAATRLLAQLAGSLGADELAEHAARLVAHPDLDARLAGAELQAVAGRLTPAAREALDEALHAPDPFARLRAVEVAAASGLPELRGLFETAVGDDEPLVRRAAVGALAPFDDSGARGALERAAADEDDLVAADAVAVLAARGGASGRGFLLDASRSSRALLRCVAAERLVASTDPSSLERVAEMARTDPDPEVRRAAVGALRDTPAARAVAAAALSDPHHAVRHAGLRLAVADPDPALAARVEALADGDPSEDVRGEALVALAATAPEAALGRVGRALLDPALAPCALRALERIAETDPDRLRRYRESEAHPRAARAVDVVLGDRR